MNINSIPSRALESLMDSMPLDVTQDITELKKIEGERRLLDWS